jgi:rhodanese-related sulfurtransferase
MRKAFFITILVSLFVQMGKSQSSGISLEFKKEIDSYLSFTIPIIKIDKLKKGREDYILLDAREKEEYDVSHIPGARYVGYDHFKLNELEFDKSKPVVVYCSIGYRSEKVSELLKRSGFKKVYNLYGSIFAWANAGWLLKDQSGKTTNRIHGYSKDWSRWIKRKDQEIVY